MCFILPVVFFSVLQLSTALMLSVIVNSSCMCMREREWVLPTQQVTWSLNYWMLKYYLKIYSLSLIYMHELLTLLTLILITVQVNVFCNETIGLFKKNIHISHVLKIHFQPSLINYAHFSLSNQFSLDKLYKRLNKKMKSCYSLFLLLHSEIR